jgi:hypothetical protein
MLSFSGKALRYVDWTSPTKLPTENTEDPFQNGQQKACIQTVLGLAITYD